MRSLTKQLKEGTKHIVLSQGEKDRMREGLVAYMEYKPIREKITPTQNAKKIPVFSFFRAHHFSGALLIAALVTSSTFGMTFAADDALPGDLLYGVKVNFNEEIKSAFLSSHESKIAWEQERAERRLTEASQLVAEGRLDEKNQEQVAKLFAEHTEAVVQEVLAAEEEDPILAAEATSVFEETLDMHEAVLARLIVEEEGSDESAINLVEQVRTVAMEVGKMRENAEEKINDEGITEQTDNTGEPIPETTGKEVESANMRVRATERTHERAVELLGVAQEQVSLLEEGSTIRIQAEAQIEFGISMMNQGAEAASNYNYTEAYGAYRQAAATFQKVAQLLDATQLFSIEIYPDMGTTTEQLVGVEELRVQAEEAIQNAQTLLLTQGGHDASIVGKANSRIKDAGAYVLRGEISMVLGDHENAQSLFGRAHDFAQEVVKMLEEEGKKDEVKNITPPENVPTEEKLNIQHTFSDGMHVYKGEINTPNPCYSVESTAVVAESFPEQISLVISRSLPESENVSCAQVEAKKIFSIQVSASEGAVLTGIILDGKNISWALTEEIDIQEGGEEQGLFERAFDTTQQIFLSD